MVSEIKEIELTDPIRFYDAAGKRYHGKRFFWENQTDGQILIGAGIAACITTRRGENYAAMQNQCGNLLSTARVLGPTEAEATGPLLVGGFAFEAEKQPSEDWASFGSGYFFLPVFLLTIQKGHCYLTRSIVCTSQDDAGQLTQRLKHEEKELFSSLNAEAPDLNVFNSLIKQTDQETQAWNQLVEEAIQTMGESGLKKVVLARSRRLLYQNELSSEQLIQALREQQEQTCLFCLEKGASAFVGATPERLIKKQARTIYSACLAGSAARGDTDKEDTSLGEWLLNDRKNRLEHHYVVSMVRDSLHDLCEQLTVPERPRLMKNKNIQHLYTPVEGICNKSASIFDFIKRLHPTPALGGLPRKQALSWIREHESLDRGYYAAPIGWCDGRDNGEFYVGIRSALLRGKEAVLFAGCGVLKDSIPEQEYKETAIKFHPMLDALSGRHI
ncbi:isochorismate synthase [Sporolactobacillus shoreicorticis]|uniref:isochorismate synthase n=1 Tax=Sporolactobacillus shoreicorticis TaxID=1923877 RepID=A0ABW5S7U2_9BACL|nr:isochorismate synthase [Sporolactobacillus shoreicorticis]MCO7125725.1 isochorismate synthase [Sporolactobacillus shoreicorticis]